MKPSILLLGGSYFIGKRIAEDLSRSSYSLTILNRGTRPCPSPDISEIHCDRNQTQALQAVLKGHSFDYVIDVSGLTAGHAASLSGALEWGSVKKLFFISSSAVYAVEQLTTPYRETDPLGCNQYWADYGTDKIQAEEEYCRCLSSEETKLVFLRPPYIYGENNTSQRESFVFDHITNNKPILIPDQGDILLQFLYTGDLSACIQTLLNAELPKVSVFNVGNREPVSIRQWISCCEQACGKPAKVIEFDYRKAGRAVRDFFPFHPFDNYLDVEKIHKLVPEETDFVEGLRRCFQWYCENREQIRWKETVAQNEAEILSQLGR